jgi:hypothetical protein
MPQRNFFNVVNVSLYCLMCGTLLLFELFFSVTNGDMLFYILLQANEYLLHMVFVFARWMN